MFEMTAGSTHRGVANGEPCWISQCSYIDADGRRRFIRGYGVTEREAIKRRQQNIARRLANPTLVSPPLRSLFDDWIESYGPNDLMPSTLAEYRRNIEQHVLPHLATVQLVNLTTERLSRFFSHDLAETGSGARVNVYKTMTHMMTWAVKNNRIDLNPLRAVDKPKHVSTVHEADDKYIEKRTRIAIYLLDWLEQPDCVYHADYNRILFSFLGLRRAELLGMTWDTITNLPKRGQANLRVKQQLHRSIEAGWHIVPRTKSGKTRKIPLPEKWRLALLNERVRQSNVKSPESWQQNLVWRKRDGRHFTYNDYAERWRSILTAYYNRHNNEPKSLPESEYWRPHANRHLTASIMFRAGESLEYVQDILGHSDEIMTLWYTHFGDDAKRDVMNTYEQALDKTNWNELQRARKRR